jgi:hypothetical protein
MQTDTPLLATTGSYQVLAAPAGTPLDVPDERRKAPRPARARGWRLGAWPATSPGPVKDYRVDADPAGAFAICRMFNAPRDRAELAGRMRELITFMRLQGYDRALIDMRASKFESAAETMPSRAALPYAINPLWRLALLAPRDDAELKAAILDAMLKAHQRAGVRMQRFDAYAHASAWLSRAGD